MGRLLRLAMVVVGGCCLTACASSSRQGLNDWHLETMVEGDWGATYKTRAWQPTFPLQGFDPHHPTEAYVAEDACFRESVLTHRFAESGRIVALVIRCMQSRGWTIEEGEITVKMGQ